MNKIKPFSVRIISHEWEKLWINGKETRVRQRKTENDVLYQLADVAVNQLKIEFVLKIKSFSRF